MTEHADVEAGYQWMAGYLAGITYHKGWRFHARYHQVMGMDPGRVAVIVDAEFPNVDRPHLGLSRQHIGTERDMTALAITRNEQAVASEVWRMVAEIEAHERCEWLRRNGQPVLDPHPDGITGPPRIAP